MIYHFYIITDELLCPQLTDNILSCINCFTTIGLSENDLILLFLFTFSNFLINHIHYLPILIQHSHLLIPYNDSDHNLFLQFPHFYITHQQPI